MHSPIKVPGTSLTLTPVPQTDLKTGRLWAVTDAQGKHLGTVTRNRENPGTRRERTRWGATTAAGHVYYPLPSRGQAIAKLTVQEDTP